MGDPTEILLSSFYCCLVAMNSTDNPNPGYQQPNRGLLDLLQPLRPRKKNFVSPTTFLRVEMCHQDSVIRDMKLDQKRA